MAKVERFEQLVVWQKARALTKAIYAVTQTGRFAKDFGLSGQIQRAAVSVMSNIAEGFERRSRTDFQRYLEIARGSCGEIRSQVYIAADVGYLTETQFAEFIAQTEEISRILRGLRDSLDKK